MLIYLLKEQINNNKENTNLNKENTSKIIINENNDDENEIKKQLNIYDENNTDKI